MTWDIRQGHVVDVLAAMEAGSVQACVTSPPYWGLRDYGDGGQDWPEVCFAPMPGLLKIVIPAGRDALGLEPDAWAYVGHLVEVFRGVRRVLRDDGVIFVNLGDSYAGGGKAGKNPDYMAKHTEFGGKGRGTASYGVPMGVPPGLKPKDMVGIPWRIAFALQADGWYLRSDVIWSKPNPMPESVTDRPTKAHEYVFILSKSKSYFWDREAVKEADCGRASGNGFLRPEQISKGGRGTDEQWTPGQGRNIRTVWTIPTKPFPGAHFATMPPALAERCVKAGSSIHGACVECGAPWARQIERTDQPATSHNESRFDRGKTLTRDRGDQTQRGTRTLTRMVGWSPTCDHDADRRPCIILDPFSGAGTTGVVALRLQRSYVGIELNPEYAAKSRRRIEDDSPLFSRIS